MILAAALMALQAPAYSVQPIFPTETVGLECTKVNDNSQVLCAVESDGSPYRAYVWNNGQLTEIAIPQGSYSGDTVSVAPVSMNNDGTVVGQLLITPDDPTHAWNETFLWSASQGMRTLTASGNYFDGGMINNKGDIVGHAATNDHSNPWTFGILHGNSEYSSLMNADQQHTNASAFNDNGEIVGQQSGTNQSEDYAYRMVAGQQPEALSLPPHVDSGDEPWKDAFAVVLGVNNGGWAVGFADMNGTDTKPHEQLGAVWSPDNTFYSIGAGYRLFSINDQGVVVGSQVSTVHGFALHYSHAIIYDTAHGVRYLDSMVPTGTPTLGRAVSINSKGEILCAAADFAMWYLLKPTS